MIDIARIGSAYEGMKMSKDIIKEVFTPGSDAAAQEKINSAVQKIGDAQDMLFAIWETIFELHATNENIRRQLAEAQDWKLSRDQYELVKTIGGAMVYRFKSEPSHYACPTCISSKSLHILQDMSDGYGTYVCYQCKSHYAVGPTSAAALPYGSIYSL